MEELCIRIDCDMEWQHPTYAGKTHRAPPTRDRRNSRGLVASLVPQARAPSLEAKIAVVCMTKQPIAFETWLEHHTRLGVMAFYIRVEDTRLRRAPSSLVRFSGSTLYVAAPRCYMIL